MRSKLMRVTWFFVRPFRALFAAILGVTVLASFLESLNVATFLPLFQLLLVAGGAAPSTSFGRLQTMLMRLSRLLPLHDPVLSSALLIVIVLVLKAAMTFLREALIAQGSGCVLSDVKHRLMERYGRSSYQFFLDTKQGTLLYHCLMAPHKVAVLALRFPQLIAELLNMIAILGLLCVMWPAAAGGLLLIVCCYNVFTAQLSRQVSYITGRGRREADAEQAAVSNELFTGIRQLMVFRTIGHWLARFQEANRRYTKLYIEDTIWLALPRHLMEVTVMGLLVGAVLLVRSAGPDALQAKLPLLGVFALALMRLIPSVTNFSRSRMEMVSLLADAERLEEELTRPVVSPPDGAHAFPGLRAAIVFEDVSFAHPGRASLLANLNLTIEQGKITAIVGASGAGKSTLINLLLGLFEPTSGRMLVDGVPVVAFQRQSWLNAIGMVSQEPFVYHASVADNILFGRSGYSREAVIKAARLANAHDFILELPHGYETLVGERGMKLSGGQQQRLAIARAMLSQPGLLVFDEATSNLDVIAEKQVQETLEQVGQDRTVIIVTHRLSTVRRADKIVVLDEGRIVEEGSHQQLLSEQGRYFHLATTAER